MILVYPMGIPLIYLTLLLSKKSIVSDALKMDHEADMGYPHIGHLTFLIKSYR